MKILHLPSNIAGNAYGLSRGEMYLGHQSDVIQVTDSWLHYPADRTLYPDTPQGKLQWAHLGLKCGVEFLRVWGRYDVYHFDFGRSLIDLLTANINLLDLPLYTGVKAMTFQGCDARQKYKVMARTKHSACHLDNCYGGICNDIKLDQAKARRIEKVDKYVDLIYALNPDLLHLLPERSRFLPYTIPSWNRIVPVKYDVDDVLHIVHAPTDRAVKGSDTIISTIKFLQEVYPGKIKLTLVEKMSHHDAIQAYRDADLVIDQLLVGWYGAVAVELMKMGIPVMTFINDEDLHFIPSEMRTDLERSVINVSAKTLKGSLSSLIEDPDLLRHYHTAGMEYADRWHDPVKVAEGVVRDYKGCM